VTTLKRKTAIQEVRTVGVPVTDQDRALAFYTDVLGFETKMDFRFGAGERWVEVAPPGGSTTIALMQSEPDGVGVNTQVRLQSEDAGADHATLLAHGVDADRELIQYPVQMFSFRDPDGNRLVIVGRPRS
jgi:catechol 2,3-dioxygenase-like lactoylglutathione lyase family enzyme